MRVCVCEYFSLAISFGMSAALENDWVGLAWEKHTEAGIN